MTDRQPCWSILSDPGFDPTWIIEQEGFDPAREREMETVFSNGNGYMGVRGSLLTPLPSSQEDLFIAGIYAQKAPMTAYSESRFLPEARQDQPYAELAPLPSPLRLRINTSTPHHEEKNIVVDRFSRFLDMQRGTTLQIFQYKDEQGRVTQIRSGWTTSLDDQHLLLFEAELEAQNYSGLVGLDFTLVQSDFHLDHPHLCLIPDLPTTNSSQASIFETLGSNYRVCICSRLWINDEEVYKSLSFHYLKQGGILRIRRLIAVATSRDSSGELMALSKLSACDSQVFNDLWSRSVELWKAFWNHADIRFLGRPDIQQAMRFNLYQLRIAASRDDRVSVPARSLSGRAYEGHVFWDAETFILPFFQHTNPDIARHMLMYRYLTLPAARRRARSEGYAGARYPWESTVNGDDVTPKSIFIQGADQRIPILTGEQQIHITADIAYGIWRYWQAVGDDEFMAKFGAEILFETARYWRARTTLEEDKKYHLRHVIGPDEYHHDVDDNAYTNWMVRKNLEHANAVESWLKKTKPDDYALLKDRMGLTDQEFSSWRSISENLFFSEPNSQGVIEQFSGFFQLHDHPLSKEERLRNPLLRLMNWKENAALRICKQADVLMIPFLFPEAMSNDVLKANFDYYEPITDHGSSLSPAVHAALAARINNRKKMEEYLQMSLNLDLMDLMKNTALGFHAANAGALWQALVFHLCQVRLNERTTIVSDQPVLPSNCQSIEFTLFLHGNNHRLKAVPPKGRYPDPQIQGANV